MAEAMPNVSYSQFTDLVQNYYANEPDFWAGITEGGIDQSYIEIIEGIPEASIEYSDAGSVLGYTYEAQLPAISNPSQVINSNVQTGSYGVQSISTGIPATATTDVQTGLTTLEAGAKAVSTGTKIAAVADKVSLGFAGVAIGTKLGKFIDEAIYAIDPEWWDEHYPTINPQTWPSMCTSETGQTLVRSIFGIEDENTTAYLDENVVAYTYAMLLENGAWSGTTHVDPEKIEDPTSLQNPTYNYGRFNIYPAGTLMAEAGTTQVIVPPGCIGYAYNTPSGRVFSFVSDAQFTGSNARTYDNITYYGANRTIGSSGWTVYVDIASYDSTQPSNSTCQWDMAYLYYNGATTETGGIEGVTENPEASTHINPQIVINPSTGQPVQSTDNIADILQALKTAYPQLFTDEIQEDVLQEDGTLETRTYVPVPYPDTENEAQPVTYTQPGLDPQQNPELNPQTRPEAALDEMAESVTETAGNAPDTGRGATPAVVIPEGSASALFTVYNPTQAQLNSFGSWLWSSNFIDQLLKLFNDPMQAIIGLHKVYAAPSLAGTSTIHVGYLDSGVPSAVVGNQYTTVNCGSVNLSEYFGNVFDYDPYTNVYIYLPFIGIQKLDTGDVMRGTLNVTYHVDVLTGACLAEVNVYRDNAGGTIYTYTGNAAVQYPISSGSYMGIVASLASVVGGVVGTIATGGALAPVAMGAVSGVLNAHTRVDHSGGFSGNAGAMGNKIPYLIVTRPQTALSDRFPEFNGYPANASIPLYSCVGFTKCEIVHTDGIPATGGELDEIETVLKNGIII